MNNTYLNVNNDISNTETDSELDSEYNDVFIDSSSNNSNSNINTNIDVNQNNHIKLLCNYFEVDTRRESNKPFRKSYFTLSMIVITTTFFIYGYVSGGYHASFDLINVSSTGVPNNLPLAFVSITSYPDCKDIRLEIWRLLSYQLVHGYIVHLVLNMFSLLLYGLILEPHITNKYGRLELMIVYFMSIIFGALGQNYINGYIGIVGCSAGVYGLFGLMISLIITSGLTSFVLFLCRIMICFQILFEVILFLCVYDVSISYVAHFCGLMIGLSISCIFHIFSDKNKYTKYDCSIILFGLSLFIFEVTFLLYYYITQFPPQFNLNPTFNKAYIRSACCYDMFNMNSFNNSMTFDYIKQKYVCSDVSLIKN
jgi:membrane associated rhomboid family serine protease